MKSGDVVIKGLNELAKGLEEERDTLANENINFADFLEGVGYSKREIDDIAGGWFSSDKSKLTKDK